MNEIFAVLLNCHNKLYIDQDNKKKQQRAINFENKKKERCDNKRIQVNNNHFMYYEHVNFLIFN